MTRALAVACAMIPFAAAAVHAEEHSLLVTASAYNSTAGQTAGNPFVGAWGDRLKPGIRAIAVSRDLLKLGLRRGTRVRIEGLEGEYRVLDKMARRWNKKIDIYMGIDEQAARDWGVRRVRIRWSSD
jgi:3D (Asp-Asp-Asp) domain-containing protein